MATTTTVQACRRCRIAADEAGWCAVCGADLVPDAGYPRFSRTAREREARWLADPQVALAEFRRREGLSPEALASLRRDATEAPLASGGPAAPEAENDEKTCPDCAETVKAAAKVCRYCGYRFGRPSPPPPAPYAARRAPDRADSGLSALVVVGYVMAVVIPIVGLILGIVAATRNDDSDRGHGPLVVALAVGSFLLWLAILNGA
jgi:RNA polymerase subunit RPABC4/transcription elongation factor Spt4